MHTYNDEKVHRLRIEAGMICLEMKLNGEYGVREVRGVKIQEGYRTPVILLLTCGPHSSIFARLDNDYK
jgi:hypothetical protein